MELLAVIFIFVCTMVACFAAGEYFDQRRRLQDEQPECLPPQAEETQAGPQQPAQQAQTQNIPEAEPVEVITGCVAEVVETPPELVTRLTELAKECAEGIAQTLGATIIDITSFTSDDQG